MRLGPVMTPAAPKLLLVFAMWSVLVPSAESRPSHSRCPASQDPELSNLISGEKRRLMDRIGRVTRLELSNDLPSPPTMLAKLAKKRKANLGKRSIMNRNHATTEQRDTDSVDSIYVVGRHSTRGATRTNVCFTPTMVVATCVQFPLSETGGTTDGLQWVSLWMHYQIPPSLLESDPTANRSLDVYEIIRPSAGHSEVRSRLITTVPTPSGVERGWVETDISALFVNQPASLQQNRVLRIQWHDPLRTSLPPVTLDETKERPFLEIVVKSIQSDNDAVSTESALTTKVNKRFRRHTHVNNAHHNHCSTRQFYVNFADFGWDSWIIAPAGYMAGYCAGACSHRSRDQGLNGLILDHLSPSLPCCAPSRRMSALQIVYADRSKGDENVVYRSVALPNMVVTDCACR